MTLVGVWEWLECSRLRVLFYILISECFFSWDFLQSSSQIVNLRKHQVHRIFDFSKILVVTCEDCLKFVEVINGIVL